MLYLHKHHTDRNELPVDDSEPEVVAESATAPSVNSEQEVSSDETTDQDDDFSLNEEEDGNSEH